MHILMFKWNVFMEYGMQINSLRGKRISEIILINYRSEFNVACCLLKAETLIDQSHRYGRPQAACREPAGSYDKTTRTAICFEHKTQYILIRAPYTRIVVFWHISIIPPMISQSQISCNTPTFYIAAIFVKYCYRQPAVGCHNSWANLRCSGCYPLGEKLLWNRSIGQCVSFKYM